MAAVLGTDDSEAKAGAGDSEEPSVRTQEDDGTLDWDDGCEHGEKWLELWYVFFLLFLFVAKLCLTL